MQSSQPLTRPASPVRWHAPVVVKASVACHVGAAVAVVVESALWPWAAGALALDHVVLTASGLWPRSTWLGDNMRRLPDAAAQRGEVAITLDDGPDPEVTPRVLDLLDAHSARATFFCITEQAARHPALCREIVARGHSIQNHSHRHSHTFAFMGPVAFRREIELSQNALAQLTGEVPRFFRAPAGLRNMFLPPVLHEKSLQLVSWTRRGYDTVRRDPAGVLRRLTRNLAAGDILLLHDRGSARSPSGQPVVLDVLPQLLQRLQAAGLRSVTLTQALEPPGRPKQGPTLPEGRSPYPATGEPSPEAAAPGRPKQGPTLSEGRSPSPATGEPSPGAAAPGRPKQGPTLPEGRSPYPAIGEPSPGAAAPGRPKQGPTLSEGRSPYPATGEPS